MAKTTLPTDFQDDVLNASMNGKRRYNEVTNDDGTFSLDDVTAYDTVGSDFGASTVNEMNRNINESFDAGKIIKSMSTLTSTTVSGYVPDALLLKTLNNSLGGLSFAQDDEGNWGYKPSGADAVIPFKSGSNVVSGTLTLTTSLQTVECGFLPSIVAYRPSDTTVKTYVQVGILINGTYTELRISTSGVGAYSVGGSNFAITDTGFSVKANASQYNKEISYIAIE